MYLVHLRREAGALVAISGYGIVNHTLAGTTLDLRHRNDLPARSKCTNCEVIIYFMFPVRLGKRTKNAIGRVYVFQSSEHESVRSGSH